MSHARNRVRAASIKKFHIKENIQFEHVDNDRLSRSKTGSVELNTRMNEGEMCDEVVPVIANDKESMEAMTAAELTEKPRLSQLEAQDPIQAN